MSLGLIIREVTLQDAKSISNIYAEYVTNTTISFEYQVPSSDEFIRRISSTVKNYPWLVVEENNEVKGYAYACSHREREAYKWSADCSIYLSQGIQGKGAGKLLAL